VLLRAYKGMDRKKTFLENGKKFYVIFEYWVFLKFIFEKCLKISKKSHLSKLTQYTRCIP